MVYFWVRLYSNGLCRSSRNVPFFAGWFEHLGTLRQFLQILSSNVDWRAVACLLTDEWIETRLTHIAIAVLV